MKRAGVAIGAMRISCGLSKRVIAACGKGRLRRGVTVFHALFCRSGGGNCDRVLTVQQATGQFFTPLMLEAGAGASGIGSAAISATDQIEISLRNGRRISFSAAVAPEVLARVLNVVDPL